MDAGNAVRVFNVEFCGNLVRRETIGTALCFTYSGWALVLPKEPTYELGTPALEQSPLTTQLSTISHDDPFPAANPSNGRARFCMKTYTENEGLLPQLVDAGVLTIAQCPQLQNGPVVEVMLNDLEISHTCLHCARDGALSAVETRELPGQPRLPACSKCKVARYCNAECQKADWAKHKKDCSVWKSNPSEAARLMENEHRAGMMDFMSNLGVRTVSLG
ncbi:hypothetical protein EXIGLDRAFT_740660 [Exidia glandulosa HHB12029]|uniref:MYND-type domain-containing protein n=1 Tax=Exidia glandulosa HHB12029 TaxID=1314781 RepID=A0A165GRA4_EXIGL|nr:hypothetical protein EXIGLDRAFT_740660 [Exidia glandulosa HHB12029]